MNIFLVQLSFEFCDIDLIIFYFDLMREKDLTFFDELKQLFDPFSHLGHLRLSEFKVQRLIDTEAFVLEFIHNLFFFDWGSWCCKVVWLFKQIAIVVIH